MQSQHKLEKASAIMESGEYDTAKKLVSEIFHGDSKNKSSSDPGMEGSLLYHMAMVTKMEAEHRLVLEELNLEQPNVDTQLWEFFYVFVFDAKELMKKIGIEVKTEVSTIGEFPSEKEKTALFSKLTEKTNAIKDMLKKEDPKAKLGLQRLFLEQLRDWIGQTQGNVAISCHGNSMRPIRRVLEHLSLKQMLELMTPHDCVFTYDFDPRDWSAESPRETATKLDWKGIVISRKVRLATDTLNLLRVYYC
jgi:hypothetical protein